MIYFYSKNKFYRRMSETINVITTNGNVEVPKDIILCWTSYFNMASVMSGLEDPTFEELYQLPLPEFDVRDFKEKICVEDINKIVEWYQHHQEAEDNFQIYNNDKEDYVDGQGYVEKVNLLRPMPFKNTPLVEPFDPEDEDFPDMVNDTLPARYHLSQFVKYNVNTFRSWDRNWAVENVTKLDTKKRNRFFSIMNYLGADFPSVLAVQATVDYFVEKDMPEEKLKKEFLITDEVFMVQN